MQRTIYKAYYESRIQISRAQFYSYFSQHKPCKHLTAHRHYSSNAVNNNKVDSRVYYGVLTPQIRAVKIFSLVSSVTGLAAQPILIKQMSHLGAPVAVALFSFVGFFTFVTPVLLHLITKKYVTHLYFNPETGEYSATILNFFLRKKVVKFTTDDVVVPDVPGMFTSFVVKDTPLFVDPRLFEEPKHYAKMMGYDKPIDFKLSNKSDFSEKKNGAD